MLTGPPPQMVTRTELRRPAGPVERGVGRQSLSRISKGGNPKGGNRPPGHSPTSHWITSSAFCITDLRIVRPSALAVFKLITNSNFVGCSTDRSPGLAPFKILST